MTITLTRGEISASPQQLLGFKSTRTARNLVHDIIDRSDPDITIKPAGLRKGTLELLCLNLAAGLAVEALHAGEGVIALEDTDRPTLDMSYVASGAITLELDTQTGIRWVVAVDYQEVTP